MKKKAILKVTIFIIILLAGLNALTPIFTYKVGHRSKLYQGLYTKTDDNYDVLLMGSSHMNGGVNPNTLWNDFGITSFNYATGGQPIDVTYYLLKEALKKHDSKYVVLDLYYLGLEKEFGEEGYIRYILDNMKFSLNKIEAVKNVTPKDERMYYLFPFLKYHSRWKELKRSDFEDNVEGGYFAKGFGASQESYGKDNRTDLSPIGTVDLPEKTEKYLYKFIELAKKDEFNLIFVNMPYDYTSTAGMESWNKEPVKMFNRVEEIAKENSIPFINYNNILDEIDFDFKDDMYNIGHLNLSGANKISLHLGKYLKENYNIVDKRNDDEYSQWNLDYEYFRQTEASKKLKIKKDIKEYIPLLKDENYITFLEFNKGLTNELLIKELQNIGLSINNNINKSNFIGILEDGNIKVELYKDEGISYNEELEEYVYLIDTIENIDKEDSILNIVVYDKIFKAVIDKVSINDNNDIVREE